MEKSQKDEISKNQQEEKKCTKTIEISSESESQISSESEFSCSQNPEPDISESDISEKIPVLYEHPDKFPAQDFIFKYGYYFNKTGQLLSLKDSIFSVI